MIGESALKELNRMRMDKKYTGAEHNAILVAIKAVEQQKKGHWIAHQDGRWIYAKCSRCETIHDGRSNYCPSCGCLMEE